MTNNIQIDKGRRGIRWRIVGWGGAALLLLLPLIANAPWTLSDFIFMGVLVGVAGLVLELAACTSGDIAYRAGVGMAVLAAFLLVWVNGAVGFLGNEDNPANLMFFGVIAIAVLGAFIAGFRAAGMARALSATAAAQLLVGVIGLAAGLGSPGYKGVYEAVMGTAVFTALWLVSAWLFHKAAGRQAPVAATR